MSDSSLSSLSDCECEELYQRKAGEDNKQKQNESALVVEASTLNAGVDQLTAHGTQHMGQPEKESPVGSNPIFPTVKYNITVQGNGAKIYPGSFELKNPESRENLTKEPVSKSIKQLNTEERLEVRRKKATDDLKFHYRTNYKKINPLPGADFTGELDAHFTDLVIKEISTEKFGQENRANSELDFRTIFQRNSWKDFRLRVLVEGNPGYGKTTLARRIALDWGRDAEYLSHFQLLIFINCRELKHQNLEDYVKEKIQESREKRAVNLPDWKDVSEQVLFVLDGLDECKLESISLINKLLQDRTMYPKSSVLATSRPLTFQDTKIEISKFDRKVEIKGFNRSHVEKIVDVYFQNNPKKGKRLKEKLFSETQAYVNLVTCPLLCFCLCYLYEDDEDVPEKITDVYMNLIKCLIYRVKSEHEHILVIREKELPPFLKETLKKFGKLCISALQKDKFYFKKDRIMKILEEHAELREIRECDVIMGFLIKTSNPGKSQLKKGKKKNIFFQEYYQPIHKTFLEFVAGFYLSSLTGEENKETLDYEMSQLKEFEWNSVEQVLMYCVELLGEEAHHVLSRLQPNIQLRDSTNLRLLSAAGCTEKNIEALTVVMNLESITVNCILAELETWAHICTQSNVIKSLRFHWNPKMASLRERKVFMFFEELERLNSSIETIELFIFHGTMKEHNHPDYPKQREEFMEQLDALSQMLRHIMCKKNLQHLRIDIQIIQPDNVLQVDFAEPVVSSVEHIFKLKGSSLSLSSLTLNFDLDTDLLGRILTCLHNYPNLTKLSLKRLCANTKGYCHLADFILQGNLADLQVKLNLNRFVSPSNPESGTPTGLSAKNLGIEAFKNTLELPFENEFTGSEVKAGQSSERVFPEVENSGHKTVEIGDFGTCKPQLFKESLGYQDNQQEEQKISFQKQHQMKSMALPICPGHSGSKSGLHILFRVLKDSRCRLQTFYLNHCLILEQEEYFSCLGEALEVNTSLKTLRVDNKMSDRYEPHIFPLIMSLRQNQHLTTLLLGYSTVQVTSGMLLLFFEALSDNSSLQILDVSTWIYKLDVHIGEKLIESLQKFLKNTSLKKLNMVESTIYVENPELLSTKLKSVQLYNNSLEVINLAIVDVIINKNVFKARDFIQLIQFSNLRSLNLSENLSLENSVPVSDTSLCNFFESLKRNMSRLEYLNMGNWLLNITSPKETKDRLKPLLLSLGRLTSVVMDNHRRSGSPEPPSTRFFFLKLILKYIPNLTDLRGARLLMCELDEDDMVGFCRALKHRAARNKINLYTLHMDTVAIQSIRQRLELSKMEFFYNEHLGLLSIQHAGVTHTGSLFQRVAQRFQQIHKAASSSLYS